MGKMPEAQNFLIPPRKCKNDKVRYKASYVGIRKQFDREIQRAKRWHWYSMQKNLLDECNVDQSQFWKSIGKIGISYANKNPFLWKCYQMTAQFQRICLIF